MSLVEHAEKELALTGDVRYQNALLGAVKSFAPYHMQINIAAYLHELEKLLTFQAMTPLTNQPREWNMIQDGLWQSSRQANAFSKDRGRTYYLKDHPEEVMCTVRTWEGTW